MATREEIDEECTTAFVLLARKVASMLGDSFKPKILQDLMGMANASRQEAWEREGYPNSTESSMKWFADTLQVMQDAGVGIARSRKVDDLELADIPKDTVKMAETLQEKVKLQVTDVQYLGEKLILPTGMNIKEAIDLLRRRNEYEDKEIVMNEVYDVFPYDGAAALDRVLQQRYGWAPAVPTPGFFMDHPPELVNVEVAPGKIQQIPWGSFNLPNVDGRLQTTVSNENGRYKFKLMATIKRRSEAEIKLLFDLTREEIRNHSIYKGQAIKLRFTDNDGDALAMPKPEFMHTAHLTTEMLIYPDHIQQAVRTNLFTPITRVHDCIKNDIPIKRGVLLGGTFGTGKTLAASVASKLAVENGITYVYVPRADEFTQAIEFAKQYQSPACVVFCEDIDRVMAGERDVNIDDILNTLDGIDSKHTNIIVVLTTNDLKAINPAMLRPGRLDAVIEVVPPDGPAIQRLLRWYGGRYISADEDLTEVGDVLKGNIPAVIAEVVKRAKLSQLTLQPPGTQVETITSAALLDSARTMKGQVEILRKAEAPDEEEDPTINDLIVAAAEEAWSAHAEKFERTNDTVRKLGQKFGVIG